VIRDVRRSSSERRRRVIRGQTGCMTANVERVASYDLGVKWEPNISNPLLVQQGARALLAVDPHFDDEDQRLVVIQIVRCQGVWLGLPNDEARSGHRLWSKGLSECRWVGEVLNSTSIGKLAAVNSVHPRHRAERFTVLRHWVLLFKEATAECIGSNSTVVRRAREGFLAGIADLEG